MAVPPPLFDALAARPARRRPRPVEPSRSSSPAAPTCIPTSSRRSASGWAAWRARATERPRRRARSAPRSCARARRRPSAGSCPAPRRASSTPRPAPTSSPASRASSGSAARRSWRATTACPRRPPPSSSPDGWLRTGDLVAIRDDGQLEIRDRLKELIKVKGASVAPAEIELVLRQHPAVHDAGVVGVPDAERGEAPIAFVSLDAPAEPDELADFAAARLAGYKRPREIVVVDEVPRVATGKLLRRALRERALARQREPTLRAAAAQPSTSAGYCASAVASLAVRPPRPSGHRGRACARGPPRAAVVSVAAERSGRAADPRRAASSPTRAGSGWRGSSAVDAFDDPQGSRASRLLAAAPLAAASELPSA